MRFYYKCPHCTARHDRGPCNGVDAYRCLRCGNTTTLLVHPSGQRRILTAHQPNFMAYLGVFEKMYVGDVFVVMDDVQMERKGFQNRCWLLDRQGRKRWVTVPLNRCNVETPINEAVPVQDFSQPLLELLEGWGYGQHEFFRHVAREIQMFDNRRIYNDLAYLNMRLIETALTWLGKPRAQIINASHLKLTTTRNERLIDYCKRLDCNTIWSGSGGALDYLDVQLFNEHGIEVQWQGFESPRYTQVNQRGAFCPGLGFLDALTSPDFDVERFRAQCEREFMEAHLWGVTEPTTLSKTSTKPSS